MASKAESLGSRETKGTEGGPAPRPLRRAELSGMIRGLADTTLTLTVPPRTKPNVENVIAHIGVGGFHRSHLAYATDRLLRTSESPWGITGVGLMPWDAKMSHLTRGRDEVPSGKVHVCVFRLECLAITLDEASLCPRSRETSRSEMTTVPTIPVRRSGPSDADSSELSRHLGLDRSTTLR